MAVAKKVLADANRGKGPLGKAADDEPIFVLRGRDVIAPEIVETWADLLGDIASPQTDEESLDVDAKIREARALAHQMRAWQEINGSKIPD